MKIESSNRNHGTHKEVIATVTCQHEIEIKVDDIISLLDGGSDNLAKIVNTLGKCFNKWELDEAYSVDDLNDDGKLFIENMYYFAKGDGGEK